MDDSRLIELINSYELPEPGKEYLRACVRNGPSRSVLKPGGRTVVGQYYSSTLQATRQFESRSSELSVMICLEVDPTVVSYFSQIERVQIPSRNRAGKSYIQRYTADLLVLRNDYPTIIEVKTEKGILKLLEEESHHWRIDEDGRPHFVPPEEYFRSLGIDFEVFDSSSLPPIAISNAQLILKVLHQQSPPSEAFHKRCVVALEQQAWMSLQGLREETGQSSLDDILYLVAQGRIHCDLTRQRLCAPDTLVSLCPEVLVQAFEERLLPTGPRGQGEWGPSLKDAEKAVANIQLARTGTCRQARRIRAKIREGKKQGKSAYESVIPNTARRGNRTKKLADDQEILLREHQQKYLLSGEKRSINQGYSSYVDEINKSDQIYPPVSVATYYRYAKGLSTQEIQKNLHGRKAANVAAKTIPTEHAHFLATRAFQRGLIDHTLLKILLVVAENDECAIVRRPYLTSLVDEYSGVVLAQWLSFNDPSTEAVCMLLRLCILRHGRVPEMIHSDRGADFKAAYVQALMAFLQVSRSFSPAASPKFNSGAETHFAKQQSGVIKQLPGNIIEYNKRKTEQIYSPAFRAIFTPSELYRLLLDYSDLTNHGLQSDDAAPPMFLLDESLRDISASGCLQELDDETYLATCVPLNSTLKPTPRQSIYIDGHHYYCSSLSADLKKKDLSIKYDPWNCNVLYIRIRGKWNTAVCKRDQSMFQGADLCKQLGESLRVRFRRQDRDRLKAAQNARVAGLIDGAISRSKLARKTQNGSVSALPTKPAERYEMERRFAEITRNPSPKHDVDWD